MGIVKFKGAIVYDGPLAEFRTHSNWNNSMAEYYPYISVTYVLNEEFKNKLIHVNAFTQPEQYEHFEVVVDSTQVQDLARIIKKRQDAEEAKTIRLHKVVRVSRGRKVPIGTQGEVFWMGDSGYGMSVGLRLICGKKVFTSIKNVDVVQLDQEFEREILGIKK